MAWFYVDDGFSDSKPVMDMPDRHRLAACGLWVLAGSWAAKEETDGFVPAAKLRQLGARPSLIETLAGSGPMLAPLWDQVEGGIRFKSWSKWQKTRAELAAKRRVDAERKRAWREANPDAKHPPKLKGRNAVTSDDDEMSRCDSIVTDDETDPVDKNECHAVTPASPSRARAQTRPDPTRPDPISIETYGGRVASVDARDPRPECPEHAENADGPCRACRRRREWDERHEAATEADELERRRAIRAEAERLLAACTLCDSEGWVLDDDGTTADRAEKCSHPEARHA